MIDAIRDQYYTLKRKRKETAFAATHNPQSNSGNNSAFTNSQVILASSPLDEPEEGKVSFQQQLGKQCQQQSFAIARQQINETIFSNEVVQSSIPSLNMQSIIKRRLPEIAIEKRPYKKRFSCINIEESQTQSQGRIF